MYISSFIFIQFSRFIVLFNIEGISNLQKKETGENLTRRSTVRWYCCILAQLQSFCSNFLSWRILSLFGFLLLLLLLLFFFYHLHFCLKKIFTLVYSAYLFFWKWLAIVTSNYFFMSFCVIIEYQFADSF